MKLILLYIRALSKFKVYTSINIIGLALSLACVIVIFRYVKQEKGVDCYTPNKDRIGIMVQEYKDDTNKTAVIGGPFEDADIETMSTFMWFNKDYIVKDKEHIDVETIVADSLFLAVTDFPMKYGKAEAWASSPQTTFITEELGEKLFGDINPIGKTIEYSTGDPLTVTGVISKSGGKRSLHFDLLVPETLQKDWDFHFPMKMALIRKGATFATINARHSEFQPSPRAANVEFRYQLLPMRDVYFHPAIEVWQNMLQKGNLTQLYLLTLVAILILIVGIFNFMSLYTVILLKRNKEFGLKKVFGNNSAQLFLQLYIENFCLTFVSLFIAWFFVEISAIPLNKYFDMAPQSNGMFSVVMTLVMLILLPLAASAYPFFKFRYNTPIHSLRRIYSTGKSSVVRNLYLSTQYIVTFILIVASIFFAKQLYEMTHVDLGYDTDAIVKVYFERYERKLPTTEAEYLKQVALRKSSKENISIAMNASPLFTAWNYSLSPYEYFTESPAMFRQPGEADFKQLYCIPITAQEMQFHGFHLSQGRLWNADIDHEGEAKLILNRKAMQLFGLEDVNARLEPQQPVWPRRDLSPYQVIGIIEDFHCGHVSQPILPIAFIYGETYLPQIPLQAKIAAGHQQDAIAFLKNLHDENADGAFNYTLATEEVKNLYKSDRQVTLVYSFFAFMAILISSIGLFGLSLFDIQQRYREIAIRKVNGATLRKILSLLLKKYIIILVISFLIAIPLSYWGITMYLKEFAYKATISSWLFIVAAVIILAISMLTLIYQVKKAASINPASIMKTE